MSRPQLRFLAGFLSFLIVVVLFAGLDDLPRGTRNQIGAERQSLAAAVKQLESARAEVSRDIAAEPDLFRARSMNTVLPERLRSADRNLQEAQREMQGLAQLERKNRHRDGEEAERLLKRERDLRLAALAESSAALAEANRWLEFKRNLPQQIALMERNYQSLRPESLVPVAAAVERAGTDWPEKKPDLEARLGSLRAIPEQAEKAWQATAELRRKAAANEVSGVDLPALAEASDSLQTAAAEFPKKTGELKALTGQLYESWDKVLVDLDVQRHGGSREYRERIKTVRTRAPSAAASSAATAAPVIATEEQWVAVSEADFKRVEDNLGMSVEHKAAGKYDSEAERVAQPAGFAYMAPPSQGSNQYGRWEQRDGHSFWVWYGQYALLRDLLFNRNYGPLERREYDEYRSAQRSGRTWYGRDESAGGAPKYGSRGTLTQPRYSDSEFARRGGFRDSQYATRSGGYGGSRYETPSSRLPRWDHRKPPDSGRSIFSKGSFGSPSMTRRSIPFRGGGRAFGRR